jgi:hypothetical protein
VTSTLKNEFDERFDSHARRKAELFDYIEVFYNPLGLAIGVGAAIRRSLSR